MKLIGRTFKIKLPKSLGSSRLMWRRWLTILRSYIYDAKRYLRYSTSVTAGTDVEQLEARITAHSHVIEKGLSFKDTRLGFGKDTVVSLINLLNEYQANKFSSGSLAFVEAVSTLKEYIKFHEGNGFEIENINKEVNKFSVPAASLFEGTIKINKEDILKCSRGNFLECSQSRYSIRSFNDEPVDLALINEAISISQKSPSVCNRQSSRVVIIQDELLKQAVLELQPGNRGFGYLADKVLIIISDQRAFFDIKERNQAYIDGGMFSMSLLYSLHFLGIGACALGWMVSIENDKKLRELARIKDSEIILMMIAVGTMTDEVRVPKSVRKNLNDIVRLAG